MTVSCFIPHCHFCSEIFYIIRQVRFKQKHILILLKFIVVSCRPTEVYLFVGLQLTPYKLVSY